MQRPIYVWPTTSVWIMMKCGKKIWFNIVNTFSFWESHFEPIQIMTSCNLENKNLQIERETQEQKSFKDWLWQDSIRLMDIIKNEKTITTI